MTLIDEYFLSTRIELYFYRICIAGCILGFSKHGHGPSSFSHLSKKWNAFQFEDCIIEYVYNQSVILSNKSYIITLWINQDNTILYTCKMYPACPKLPLSCELEMHNLPLNVKMYSTMVLL